MNTKEAFFTEATTTSMTPFKRHTTAVLLVEDDDVVAARLERELAQPGSERFVVHRITHLSEMRRHRARDIDLVFLDTSLPDATGLAAVEQARAYMANIPIVVLAELDDKTFAFGPAAKLVYGYVIKTRADRRELVRAFRYARARVRHQELDHCLARADRLAAVGSLTAGVAGGFDQPADAILESGALLHAHIQELRGLFDELKRNLFQDPNEARRARVTAMLADDGEELLRRFAQISHDNLVAAERITSLLGEVRSMAQPVAQPTDYIQPNDVVEEACSLMRPEIDACAHLVLELGRVPSIMADRVSLVHAVVSLLRNAVESFEDQDNEGNRVTVTTRYVRERIILSVADTGRGLGPDLQRRAFEPFVTTKPPGQGLGLGLPLCAEYVRQQGGELRLASGPNAGARFEIHLPEARHASFEGVGVADDLSVAPFASPWTRDGQDGPTSDIRRTRRQTRPPCGAPAR